VNRFIARPIARHIALACSALLVSGALAAQTGRPSSAGSAVQRQPLQLTLDSAVAIAVRTATPVLLAQNATKLSGAVVLQRYAQFLPDLSGNSGFSQYVGNPLLSGAAIRPTDSRFRDLGYQVSSTLNLFNGFADIASLKAALANRTAADLALERVKQTIALDVTQAYLRVILDDEIVSIARQNLSASNERVAQLTGLVQVGQRPPADLYRQQAQAAADQSTLVDAENRVRTDEIGLLERLRMSPHQPVQLAPPPVDTMPLGPQYVESDELVLDATMRRADLLAANARLTASERNIARAKSGYLPQLDLGASAYSAGRFFDYANTNGATILTQPQTPLWDQVGRQTTGVLALGFNWYLFDRDRTRLDVETAQVGYDSAFFAGQDLRLQVAGDVAQSLGDYQTAVQQLAASSAQLAAAQQAYDLVNGRFAVGFASIVDVTTAQAALVQAQSQRAETIVSMTLRKRGVAYALGFNPVAPLP
jgi:outer membrane protein